MKVFSSVILLLTIGCAQQKVMLTGAEKPYENSVTETPVRVATKKLHIVEVLDNRTEMSLGEARTGVQYSKTPVLLDKSMANFLSKYFKDEFYKRNILTTVSGGVEFKIMLNKLWLSEVLDNTEAAKCEANFSFYAVDGAKTWKGNVWTEFQSKGDLSDGTEKLGPTLTTCLNNVVEKLVADKSFVDFIKL